MDVIGGIEMNHVPLFINYLQMNCNATCSLGVFLVLNHVFMYPPQYVARLCYLSLR